MEKLSNIPDASFIGGTMLGWPERRSTTCNKSELNSSLNVEVQLRAALAANADLLRDKDALIQHLQTMSKESDHRLLNGMQLIASLIAMQSRKASCREVAAQLDSASERIAMVARVHRRLHSLDQEKSVAFDKYLSGLCDDYSSMLTHDHGPNISMKVSAPSVELPCTTAAPLGYIVSELVTNAAKHGDGRIVVSLEPTNDKRYALSVTSGGSRIKEGFVAEESDGLGMKIVQSFVNSIGGELRVTSGDGNEGARFTVLFS
jgi:two-component sensor histidine kinase